jgi:hypothetical protein
MELVSARAFYPESDNSSTLRDEIAALDKEVAAQVQTLRCGLDAANTLYELEDDAAKLAELLRLRRNKRQQLCSLNRTATVKH